ncbi:glycosyltransferase [Gryllotalpicola koreensis]|uniref:glycosyltransferase n=1 Tax=Gryllotalpicola koreensis TaxID=993086 RepID=UPI0031DABE19
MAPTDPGVSVALCTRNGARFVGAQLHSILAQSPAPAQLVVSDDDSSDDTLALARQAIGAANARPEVHWIENRPPLGVTKNFEGAVRAATGGLIALSDQDDIWHAGKLERAVAIFDRDPEALLLFTDARLVDAEGAPLGFGLFESLGLTEAELGVLESRHALDALLRRNVATGATVVFRRDLLEKALPFPSEWVHDEWLAIVAALHGGVRVLREQTVDYRQHGGNEIGVVQPTLAYRIRRMMQSRGTRNAELAAKFGVLADWADGVGYDETTVSTLRAKARFEAARAAFPSIRLARMPHVLALATRRLYPRFASQGWLDVVRDLVQRA